MSLDTLPRILSTWGTRRLQEFRRRLEAELLAEFSTPKKGTTAHVRKIAVLTAAGAELSRRDALIPKPTTFDTCWVDGVRLSFQVRVF